MTEIIAEINDLVALAKALADQIVQADETLRFGMDGGDGPHPPGNSQASKNLRPPRPGHAAPHWRRGPNQAVSNCSTRWVAVVSSMRSTAANSRTKRSSAAW
jgi:hypothetical protein